jgi:ribosomal protein L7/L12
VVIAANHEGAKHTKEDWKACVGTRYPQGMATLSQDQVAHLQGMLVANQKIQAIKLAREWTGLGLKEAMELVERLPYEDGDTVTVGVVNAVATGELGVATREHMQEVADIARSRGKIEAIKRLRELTGLGLAEAKEVVDLLPALGAGPAPLNTLPQPADLDGRPNRLPLGLVLVLVLALLAGVVWLFLRR